MNTAPPKIATAHYMPQWGRSAQDKPFGSDYYDTKFVTPALEYGAAGGKGDHRKYGGLWRDQPSPVVVGNRPRGGDFKLADCIDECKDAQAYGLDAFSTDLLTGIRTNDSNWQGAMRLLDAAAQVPGFSIVTMADCNTSFGDQTVADMAASFKAIYNKPASYKLPDGRFVISTFKAETVPVATWRQVFDTLKSQGVRVAFWPVFLNYATGMSGGWSTMPETVGVGEWGSRNPLGQASHTTHAKDAHSKNLWWYAPVSVQDERPNQGNAYESQGPLTLMAAWDSVDDVNAEWVQCITWNDWAEGALFSPSRYHGYSWLKLNQYRLIKWKTGTAPELEKDFVLVSNRKQLSSVKGTYAPPSGIIDVDTGAPMVYNRMAFRSGNTPVDKVYVLCILKEQRHLEITVGPNKYYSERPIGLSIESYPLAPGNVGVAVSSTGVSYTVTGMTVVATPLVQDLQYTAVVNDETPFSPTQEDSTVIAELQAQVDALTQQVSTAEAGENDALAKLAQANVDLSVAQDKLSKIATIAGS